MVTRNLLTILLWLWCAAGVLAQSAVLTHRRGHFRNVDYLTGCVARWTGSSGDVATDGTWPDSAGANDATLTGDTTVDDATPGATLDGVNDYIACGTGASLDITGNLTFMAWFKTNVELTAYAIGGKWGWSSPDNKRSYYLQVGSDGKPDFFVSSDGTEGGSATVEATTVCGNVTWHHVAGVYDGAEIRIYVNAGAAEGNTSFSAGIYSDATRPFELGVQNTGGATRYSFFGGVLDDIRVYNAALSQSQIQTVYDATSGAH